MVKLVLTIDKKEMPTEKSRSCACPVSVKLETEEGKENDNKATELEMFLLIGIRKIIDKVFASQENVQKIVDDEQREFIEHISKNMNKNGKIEKDEPDVNIRV